MTTVPLPSTAPGISISPEALSKSRVIALLSLTVLLALAVYYFVGVDEGMTSIFGKSMTIHEWVHDSRHFLGFPCH
jgi:cobalt transporter subunit CbtB